MTIEKDFEVSRKVMGYDVEEWKDEYGSIHFSEAVKGGESWGFLSLVPPYSTNVASAWRVVEHLRTKMGLECYIHVHPQGHSALNPDRPELDPDGEINYLVQFTNPRAGWPNPGKWPVGHGKSLPEAICMAALRAVEEGGVAWQA